MMKVKMMNIVNPHSLDHFDQHSESLSPVPNDEHSEYSSRSIRPVALSEINIWGIIYIYTRTPAQTETQSLTYGCVVCLIWYVGFGVFRYGLTDVPTLFMCGSLCWFFDQCVFLFRCSC